MQQILKVKTDYKHGKNKPNSSLAFALNKWKLPLACSLLAFSVIWRLSPWGTPSSTVEDESWLESNQVTLNVSLPKNQEETLLIQPATIAETSAQMDWRTFTVKAGDTLALYFQQAGLDSKSLQEVLSIARHAHYLKKIYPGQSLKLQANEEGQLQALHLDMDPMTTLMVHRQENGKLHSRVVEKPIEKRVAFGGSRIVDSFFIAGKQAQLDDALILELANIFAYDIDFALDIQPNDHFKVLFEEYFVNGVKVGNGPIIAAEFVNNGKYYRAIRYVDSTGHAGYYSPSGHGLKKAFLRTPVQFTRISSHFNAKRHHPILHTIRAHKGVDYAAPTGTPVRAAGNGKVIFAGKKGGYGNVIILQHGTKYSTLYGHLSSFAKNLKTGKTVKQGQIIGAVGSTGLASGPHLHYEFRINGVHHNPLTVTLPQDDGVPARARPQFVAHANELLRLMDRHQKTLIAANEF